MSVDAIDSLTDVVGIGVVVLALVALISADLLRLGPGRHWVASTRLQIALSLGALAIILARFVLMT